MAKRSNKKTVCPQCGTKIPVFPKFPTWCECGWNLDTEAKRPPTSALGRWITELVRKRSMAVFDAFLTAPEPGSTSLRLQIALYALAASVHLLNVLFAAGGIYLLVKAPLKLIAIPVYLILLMMGWFGRPRFGRMPEEIAPNDEFPVLHAVARRAASALGMPFFDAIVITRKMSASVGRVGPRRRRVLLLGAPLFVALDREEKLALLGHEIAHFKTIDPKENAVVSITMRTLDAWANGLPRALVEWSGLKATIDVRPIMALAAVLVVLSPVFMLMSVVPVLYTLAFSLLTSERRQRHEYYSDYLGGRLAGVEAAQRLMKKLLVAHAFEADLKAASDKVGRQDAAQQILERFRDMPLREVARLERIDGRRAPGLGASHPRFGHRIAALHRHGSSELLIEISEEEDAALREELRPYIDWDHRGLVSLLRRLRVEEAQQSAPRDVRLAGCGQVRSPGPPVNGA